MRLVSSSDGKFAVAAGGGGGDNVGSSPSALDRDRVTTGDSVGEELAIIDGTDDAKDGTTGESISY